MNGDQRKCVLLEAQAVHDRLGSNFELSAFGIQTEAEPVEDEDADGDEPADTSTAYDVTALSDLSPADGYTTILVEVADLEEGDDDAGWAYKGEVDDGTDLVPFIAFDALPELEKLETGNTYRIFGTRLEPSEKYGPQLKFSRSRVEIEEVDRSLRELQKNEQLDATTATDGGGSATRSEQDPSGVDIEPVEQVREKVRRELVKRPSGTVVDPADLADDLDEPTADVRAALDAIKHEESQLEAGSGYRVI